MNRINIFFSILFLFFSSMFLSSQDITHRVIKGDTLYSLARNYGTEVNDILQLNGMSSSDLREGMILQIPGSSPARESYVVQRGDTLYSISRRFSININELMALNQFSSGRVLREGDIILLHHNISDSGENRGSENTIPTEEHTVNRQNVEINEEENGNSVAHNIIINSTQGDGVPVRAPQWPVNGMKTVYSGSMDGVLIQSESGASVHAVLPGRVVWTGPYREFGQVVLVDTGEHLMLYGGSRDIYVNIGEMVGSGTILGRLDYDGGATPVAMFFSAFKEGRVIDIHGLLAQ